MKAQYFMDSWWKYSHILVNELLHVKRIITVTSTVLSGGAAVRLSHATRASLCASQQILTPLCKPKQLSYFHFSMAMPPFVSKIGARDWPLILQTDHR